MGNFSYSKLEVYNTCPFKYKIQYEDGMFTYIDTLATLGGTLVHKTEENIAIALRDHVAINYEKLIKNFVEEGTRLKQLFPEDFSSALDKSGRTYANKANYYLNEGIFNLETLFKRHPEYQIVGIEQEFDFDFDEYHFHGFIDRVFYDKLTNKYIIQDIKTYAVPLAKDKLTTPLQFVVYTLAVQKLYNCRFEDICCQYYLPFCENEFGEAGLTQSAGTKGFLDRGCTKLHKLLKNIADKEFAPKVSALCAWCAYSTTNPDAPEATKYLCPYHCAWDRVSRRGSDIKKVAYSWQGLQNHEQILESYKTKSISKLDN